MASTSMKKVNGTADYQRMYQLIRQPQPVEDRLFESSKTRASERSCSPSDE